MATLNPFDLLGDDDNDDPTQLIAKKALAAPATAPAPQQQPKQQAKLPSKPLPPAQAVREAKSEGRGGGRGGGRGYPRGGGGGRGGGGYNRDYSNNENSFSNNGVSAGYGAPEERDGEKNTERRGGYGGGGPRPYRGGGGRRGGSNGDAGDGERPRRVFERRSGTGRGNDIKREGSGRGNWGTSNDEVAQETEEAVNVNEKIVTAEKQPGDEVVDAEKETPVAEPEEKEPEDKEMTLEEYEKVLEEKRKALLALKVEERKVDVDKDFETMQKVSNKKANDEIFVKLGSEKDKKKEAAEKEEKAKKSPLSINEFLKPTEGGDRYYPGGRGRGRGGRVGGRGGSRGGYGGGNTSSVSAPSIEDPGQFPTLGGK